MWKRVSERRERDWGQIKGKRGTGGRERNKGTGERETRAQIMTSRTGY